MIKISRLAAAGFAALALACALVACAGTTPAQDGGSEQGTGIANPWHEVTSAEEAAGEAGVGTFALPEEGLELSGGALGPWIYRWMDDIAEAQSEFNGSKLTVRKWSLVAGDDLSGDYNDYAYVWEYEANGYSLTCKGAMQGKAQLALAQKDSFGYCVALDGEADGLTSADLDALFAQIG